MDVDEVESGLHRALGTWAVASAAGGGALWLVGRRTRRPVLRASGTQTLLWAAVDGALAVIGALRARRSDPTPRARLRRLLVVNAVADVGYVAAGAALAARPRSAPRWLRWPDRSGVHLRGHGLAVVVQGAFLAVLDTVAALRLRDHPRAARRPGGGAGVGLARRAGGVRGVFGRERP